MFIFVINYCSNMFRPQSLTIFRELAKLLTYTAYVVTYVEEVGFKHQYLTLYCPTNAHNVKKVQLLKHFKIKEAAPTRFGLQRNQTASVV